MLGGFSKALLGHSLLVGTGISLGVSFLKAIEFGNVGLSTATNSPREIGLAGYSHSEVSAVETTQTEESKATSDSAATLENRSSNPTATRRKGCTIHQLNSSAGSTWSISEIGSWEQFWGEKYLKGESINEHSIRQKCNEEPTGDVLVVRRGWFWRKWDYSDWDQKHQQFKDYLEKRKQPQQK
ncbi:hypothetical protein MHF_0687 [Mycoplasma haemofelis Ohio2]|uniref:Uncharacterized protein n=1 Tax=Mycoplasma haemofelis (strain Ohio2) TaxID=859194 RepID=F6FIA9_MYCHI|nr:hypothetical protein MHF_0687 [Mycoplasma haemofelis Ohio2]